MFVHQIYTACLSEASYYVESEGEAAIIDPIRDIDGYLKLASERNASIKYIFETHFHADFVSGHLDLAKATGAPIIYGPETKAGFPVKLAADGEQFKLGKVTIEVLHTPGHTLESSCYLLKDENGKDYALFTGDTLFVGDVGRPDLAQKENEITMEDLAGMLFDSLQTKIVPLADDVIVYPAHGPGSSCGKNLGPSTYSTIGDEKRTNYALLAPTKEVFITQVTSGLEKPPGYFPVNAKINKEGYDNLDDLLQKGLNAMTVPMFKDRMQDDNVILIDTRPAEIFTEAFVPGSVSIGLEGKFAEWAGMLIPYDREILLIAAPGKEKESLIRLARVGFKNFAGYLDGGIEQWKLAGEPVDMIIDVMADELAMDIPFDENLLVMDVRKESEYADGHVKGAVNVPLHTLTDPASMSPIEDNDNMYIHCQGGYRSVIAGSLLKRQGFHNLRNVKGGWNAIKDEEKIEQEKGEALK